MTVSKMLTGAEVLPLLADTLVGCELFMFTYGTGFSLTLERRVPLGRQWPPRAVALSFHSDCSLLHPELDRAKTLADFPVRTNEPDESVLAAMLVKLRWDGGPIEEVDLVADDGLSVRWQDGSVLRVQGGADQPGSNWLVAPCRDGGDWFVRSEFGQVSGRGPNPGAEAR